MGWASRARINNGNSKTALSSHVRWISASAHFTAFRKAGPNAECQAQFSDRTYLVDVHGTMRRAPVEVPRGRSVASDNARRVGKDGRRDPLLENAGGRA